MTLTLGSPQPSFSLTEEVHEEQREPWRDGNSGFKVALSLSSLPDLSTAGVRDPSAIPKRQSSRLSNVNVRKFVKSEHSKACLL